MAAPAFLVEPTANLTATGLVWAFSGDSGIAWGGMAFLLGIGIARDAIQTKILRGSFPNPRHLLLSPVKDLVLLAVWLDALVSDRIEWRGNRFLIGRFTRLRSGRTTRRVRRRVRKIRRVRKHHHE
jgi:ceramide glucosyltransferase